MKLDFLRISLLFILAIFASECLTAQTGALFSPYRGRDIATITLGDTISFDGEFQVPRTWPAEIRIRRPGQGTFKTYKAGEATALVLNDRTHFRALPVEMKNGDSQILFVEVLSRGKVFFFELPKGKYPFMVFDGEYTHLSRSNYRDIIEEFAESCPANWCSWQRTAFTRRSLRFFFDRHNRGNLNTRFPMMNAGIGLQYNFMLMKIPGNNEAPFYYNDFNLTTSWFSPTLFMHIPFYNTNNLGLDFQVSRHAYVATNTEQSADNTDYIMDSWLDFAWYQGGAALRYTFTWNHFEPFIAGGMSYMHPAEFSGKISYFHIHQNIYSHYFSDEVYPAPGAMLGLTIKQGIQYSFLPRSYAAAELGFSRYSPLNGSGYLFNNFFISLSVNFWPW